MPSMKTKLLRRIAPTALAVGIGLGAAGATADAAATAAPATDTTYGCVVGPVTHTSLPPYTLQFQTTTCTGPNGVARRLVYGGGFFSVVYLNGQVVTTNNNSDAFLRQLAGLP
jgi:hypothetical protein